MGPSSYAFRGISDLLMSIDLYEVWPHKVYRGVNLISDALTTIRRVGAGTPIWEGLAAESKRREPFESKRAVPGASC